MIFVIVKLSNYTLINNIYNMYIKMNEDTYLMCFKQTVVSKQTYEAKDSTFCESKDPVT